MSFMIQHFISFYIAIYTGIKFLLSVYSLVLDMTWFCELTRDHESVIRTWQSDVGPHNLHATTIQIKLPELNIWYQTKQLEAWIHFFVWTYPLAYGVGLCDGNVNVSINGTGLYVLWFLVVPN